MVKVIATTVATLAILGGLAESASIGQVKRVPVTKRDAPGAVNSNTKVSSALASLGSSRATTTIKAGVTYWMSGLGPHNIYGSVDNQGSLLISQTDAPFTPAGIASAWTAGSLKNRNGASIVVNDFSAATNALITWSLDSFQNDGNIQFCARGNLLGSTYRLTCTSNSCVNNGLIAYDQVGGSATASMTLQNLVLSSGSGNPSQTFNNNGAVLVRNGRLDMGQNYKGSGCWIAGTNGKLQITSGCGLFQNPSNAPALNGQSINMVDGSSVVHFETGVYSRISKFGANVFGFGGSNTFEFDEIVSSVSYSSDTLTVKLISTKTIAIKIGRGYTSSKFIKGLMNVRYSSAPPAGVAPSGCQVSTPVCSSLSDFKLPTAAGSGNDAGNAGGSNANPGIGNSSGNNDGNNGNGNGNGNSGNAGNSGSNGNSGDNGSPGNNGNPGGNGNSGNNGNDGPNGNSGSSGSSGSGSTGSGSGSTDTGSTGSGSTGSGSTDAGSGSSGSGSTGSGSTSGGSTSGGSTGGSTENAGTTTSTGPTTPPTPPAPVNNKYAANSLGCFTDAAGSGASRTMNDDSYTSDSLMTNQACANYCGDKGFRYSGTQYASQCFCSALLPTVSSESCNMQCNGDSTQTCGGSWALSVFDNTALATTAPTMPANYDSVGCFADSVENRIFTGYSFSDDAMTAEKCASTCSSKGFAFSGTEYARECYCSGYPAITTSNNCNMACTGNKAETCGGPSAMSVLRDSTISPFTTAPTCATTPPGWATCKNGQKVVDGACVDA